MPLPLSSRRRFLKHSTLAALAAGGWPVNLALGQEKNETPLPNRPKVPGTLTLRLRSRVKPAEGKDLVVEEKEAQWQVAETAVILCDMWDKHWCQAATERVEAMSGRMNHVTSAARSHGVMIIHAPSDTLDFYKDTPFRKRMQQAPAAEPPVKIERWCYLDKDKEIALPIDDSDGGCDDAAPVKSFKAWSRQHPAIAVTGYDGVSENGQEIYNWCRQNGVKNVALMGVHTNMCVLGRSFGIRQMVRLGMGVVLVRDLTDAMYDPRDKPFVSHTRGTHLVIEHIERHWCPTISSQDLIQVVPGSADAGK